MLGFELDFWDYVTFATLFLSVGAGIVFWLFLAGLPGRIALARKHPEAEAVKYLGYAHRPSLREAWNFASLRSQANTQPGPLGAGRVPPT